MTPLPLTPRHNVCMASLTQFWADDTNSCLSGAEREGSLTIENNLTGIFLTLAGHCLPSDLPVSYRQTNLMEDERSGNWSKSERPTLVIQPDLLTRPNQKKFNLWKPLCQTFLSRLFSEIGMCVRACICVSVRLWEELGELPTDAQGCETVRKKFGLNYTAAYCF